MSRRPVGEVGSQSQDSAHWDRWLVGDGPVARIRPPGFSLEQTTNVGCILVCWGCLTKSYSPGGLNSRNLFSHGLEAAVPEQGVFRAGSPETAARSLCPHVGVPLCLCPHLLFLEGPLSYCIAALVLP